MSKPSTTDLLALFRQLHHAEMPLLLPNIWDPLGASLLQGTGLPAVATSSSAMALSNGYHDGQKLPFNDLLKILRRITDTVQVPVSADIERGYAETDAHLADHIKQLLGTGIVGINYEDSLPGSLELLPMEQQVKSLAAIRKAADEAGIKLFINARVDVYIKGGDLGDDEKLKEATRRGNAYKEAGADGLYPILLKDPVHMETLVQEVGLPLNITMVPGIPDLSVLKAIGVARISLASGFLRHTAFSMLALVQRLLQGTAWAETMRATLPTEQMNQLIPE
jgi:2-methylisocitrate lyase-like PEP mutase family enzyme